MTPTRESAAEALELAGKIALQLRASRRTIAVAESLTSGMLSARLGAAPEASEWFRGGVVAYAPEVKFTVLGVPEGPVVTASCASAMASGVARLMLADVGIGITGVGGPGSEEGRAAGTVFIAICNAAGARTEEFSFAGEPEQVVHEATASALRLCLEAIAESTALG